MATPGLGGGGGSGIGGLVSFLQNELVSLANEATKRNPEVKDAAERLSYLLRELKDRVSAGPDAPVADDCVSELARMNDSLARPFLLALESKQPKLISISITCVQKLILQAAAPRSCIRPLLEAMGELQAGVMEHQLKVLQILLPLLTNYDGIHGPDLAVVLQLCLRMLEAKGSPIVSSTASATLSQLVIGVFDRVVAEDWATGPEGDIGEVMTHASGHDGSGGPRSGPALRPCALDAHDLFLDICLVTSGESGKYFRASSFTKAFGFEIIESILANHFPLFRSHPELLALLKERVCPLFVKMFSEKMDFPLTIRLLRIAYTIIRKYGHEILAMECEIFLSMFAKITETHALTWQRILVLEIYRGLCGDAVLLRSLYRVFDANQANAAAKVVQDMAIGLVKLVVFENTHTLMVPTFGESGGSPGGPGAETYALVAAMSSMRVPCLDQLDKAEPPAFPERYPLLLACQCLAFLGESQSSLILPALLAEGQTPEADIFLAVEMANDTWVHLLTAYYFLLNASIDDEVYHPTLKAYVSFTSMVGLLGLTLHRDCFLGALCKIAVPAAASRTGDLATLLRDVGPLQTGILARILKTTGQSILVHERHLSCLRSLISIVTLLTGVMDERAWYPVLETLQVADGLVSAGKLGRKEQPSFLGLSTLEAARDAGPKGPGGAPKPAQLENQFMTLLLVVRKFFEKSEHMALPHFALFVRALCKLALDSVAGASGVAASAAAAPANAQPAGVGSGAGKDKGTTGAAEEKSFAITKLFEVSLANLRRMLTPTSEVWECVVASFIGMAHHPHATALIRAQTFSCLSELFCAATRVKEFVRDAGVEMHVLYPLQEWLLVEPCSVQDKERVRACSWFPELQRSGYDCLHKILQSSGQSIRAGWELVFLLLTSGLQACMARSRKGLRRAETVREDAPSMSQGDLSLGGGGKFGAALVRIMFPCVQLICSDFLDLLSPARLHDCIACLGSFGAQMEELNVSLTAIGLLWSTSDYVLTKKQREQAQTEVLAESSPLRDEGQPMPSTSTAAAASWDALWMYLLQQLSRLCADPRPEARNSANQSLFRMVAMNGNRFVLSAWKECLDSILLPLLDRVQEGSTAAEAAEAAGEEGALPGGPLPMSHHSRNSAAKQWDETKVFTLNGITRTFVDFMLTLVQLEPGDLDRMWRTYLAFVEGWAVEGSAEVSVAAMRSLKLLMEHHQAVLAVSAPVGSAPISVPGSPSKWEALQRVCFAIGRRVVQGAEGAGPVLPGLVEDPMNADLPLLPVDPLFGRITQEFLLLYSQVMGELLAIAPANLHSAELRVLAQLLLALLLYHPSPPKLTAASSPRMVRMDLPNDVEGVTSLQAAVLGLVSRICAHPGVPDAPDTAFALLTCILQLPFFAAAYVARTGVAFGRYFTYVALGKQALEVVEQLVAEVADVGAPPRFHLPLYHANGGMPRLLAALRVPLASKYDCPKPGPREVPAMWKVAAKTFLVVVPVALRTVEEHHGAIGPLGVAELYLGIADTMHQFLLADTSAAMSAMCPEELAADEDFELTLLAILERDVAPAFGRTHVPEEVLARYLQIFAATSRLYTLRGTDSPPAGGAADLDIETRPVRKARIGFESLRVLFRLSSPLYQDDTGIWDRIALVTGSVLVGVLTERLQAYIRDRPLFARIPMPGIRHEEMVFLLHHLAHTDLRSGVLLRMSGGESGLRGQLLSGPNAHLFLLYPMLCDLALLVAGPTGKQPEPATAAVVDEEAVALHLRLCFRKIGQLLGIERMEEGAAG